MTDTSPIRPLEVDAERPLEPATVALLRAVRDACADVDAAFVVAGATARDILMWHVYGIRPMRATRDVDVAVCAVSWPFHDRLVDTLVATGQFARAPKHQQKLLFAADTGGWRTELDLVPFGPLEAPPGEIAWPPGGEFVLNVLGFQEAVDHALPVAIDAHTVVPVASLPALSLLKLLAWKDRRARQNNDAYDLLFLLTHADDAGDRTRIWDVAPDLLAAHDFEPTRAAAALLARDAKRIASPATRDAVRGLLSDRATYATLGQDLLARAFAWQPGDFTDDAERHLHAFRDAFLADEPDAGAGADAHAQRT
ncbi:nucleotidyl transferase AbiEii/AbiGii toxin family protein [Burkholderia multivorans]|uniref:nucleotidyl transferase AbiEii/AbiGii toxin family protein n=1 Tax=Burkholderia multivorans TaxID=87883 RepID=UPI001C24AD6B|nr:nucleotidyl transferase AbiEii/AbiGii toxin family protein [Burkholderia multivorans]MBU9679071.1 nucleotidyl transferase AbiEii/AbiGii toxin family protein [Burkholderia multivorans]